MDLHIQVRDADAPFLMELLGKFDFVNIKETTASPVLEGLERSLDQMKAMREGKLPKPSVAELFAHNE
ncbi:hypothetical protein J2I47_23890 [Fibrella sp. HMF5335]|uniref:Uncharacterized protein n=1 Tax=Fibrella rubiginis TaxID=2817060 RepID=A0A939GKN1_9BACT|nr:hypothetical protein [Fibrella rubiginis]MBO0939613.1 hypothetical protein [Fibrella rubiginis]